MNVEHYHSRVDAAYILLSGVFIDSPDRMADASLPDSRVNELLQALRATHYMAAKLYEKLQAAYPHVVPYGEPPQCQ